MSKRKRWPWIVLGVLFGLPCLIGGFGLVGLKISFSRVAGTLPAELSAAKAAGIPVDAGDLRAMIAVPDKDNAAPDFQRALGLRAQWKLTLPREYSGSFDDLVVGRQTPEEEKVVRKGISTEEACFKFMAQAADKPGLDWHRQWEKGGAAIMFNEVSEIKELCKDLEARAVIEGRSGNTDAAFRDIGTVLKIAHLIGIEPALIAFLVQGSIEASGFQTLEKVLNSTTSSVEQLESASKMVADLKELPPAKRTLAGELAMYVLSIRALKSYNDLGAPDSGGGSGAGIEWLIKDANYRKASEAKALHYFRPVYISIPAHPTWKQMKSSFADLDTAVMSDSSLENKVNQILMPVFSSLPDVYTKALATRRIMAESLAILETRRQTGHLPATRPNLGETGTDPFTLRPLVYKVVGTGFKVYSVDSDLVDDGGLTRHEDRSGKFKTHDIAGTFR